MDLKLLVLSLFYSFGVLAMGPRSPERGPELLKSGTFLPEPKVTIEALEEEMKLRILADESISLPAHFSVLFGNQGEGNPARLSHTFGSVIRVNAYRDSNKELQWTFDWSTVSWLPFHFAKTRQICVFQDLDDLIFGKVKCSKKRAHNFSLELSLQWARESDAAAITGPDLIVEEAYLKALKWRKHLERSAKSGQIKYIADDRPYRATKSALNCMHAVSDFTKSLSSKGGILGTGLGSWGIAGTQHALEHFYNYAPHLFLEKRLDARRYRIFRGLNLPAPPAMNPSQF